MEIKNWIIAAGVFCMVQGSSAQIKAPSKDFSCEISCLEQKGAEGFFNGVNKSIVPPDYDIKWHQLELNVNPAVSYIEGKISTRLTPVISGVNSILFDCSDSLTVDSVYFEGIPVSFSRPGNDGLEILLPVSMTVGTLYNVAVWYQGNPASTGMGSFANETHNGVPVMWTLSEPYGARDWWPCKQSLNDKIDSINVIVTTPQAYKTASNGLLLSETTNGGLRTAHWRHRYPIPAYLVSIAVTNYVSYYDYVPYSPNDSIPVLNYCYPEHLAGWQSGSAEVKNIMPFFNQKFGLYPYHTEKYGHAEMNWGGGMEHTTMSSMGGIGYELLAHELGHQWFGDMVTCGSWEDIWLNEGFASYMVGLVYEHFTPTLYWPLWKSQNHDFVMSQSDGSVWVNDTTNVGRIFDGRLSYSKGAYVLHMLRWVVGDDNFYAACNSYLNDPALRFGYARTSDLKHHFETVSGMNLTEFFNDWVYGQGFPTYTITWSQDGSLEAGLNIHQAQSHPSVSFFEMPVPIRFYGAGQDTTVVFDVNQNDAWHFAQLDFVVDSFHIDPDLWILCRTGVITLGQPDQMEIAMTMYPNPSSDVLFFQLPSDLNALNMRILDLSGKVCLQQNTGMNTTWSVNIQSLASGTYLVRVETDKGTVYRKLIKD